MRFLLDAANKLKAYVPVDISGEFLAVEAQRLRQDYPNLSILPVVADFMQPFALPDAVADLPKIGFFPGSTIGNFEPHEACAFLRHAGDDSWRRRGDGRGCRSGEGSGGAERGL